MTYFKVVDSYNGCLVSTSYRSNLYVVSYERTKPRLEGSQLLVFDSFVNAFDFVDYYDRCLYKIFECEVDSPTPCKYLSFDFIYIKAFWEKLPNHRLRVPPKGTVGCKVT